MQARNESIMTLPTWCTDVSGWPSASRFRTASGEGARSTSLRASVTTRLISSGIVRSKDRSPASTCATLMPHFEAVSAPASVELTSPTTTTRSGRTSPSTGSSPVITRAVCSAWVPDPTASENSGSGMPRSRKKTSDIHGS